MKAEELRKSILQQAIQGKLVAQDPTDEPASVLLERIREEKKQLVKDKKIKKDKNESIIYKGDDNSHYEKIGSTVRCIDDEIPFEIPNSWAWCRLGSLFNHNTGKALNAKNTQGELLEYITTSNLYWNRFELSNLRKMHFSDNEKEKCTATKGDLLVCEGGDIGRASIWEFDSDIRIQNHIHKLRAFIPLCTMYFYHIFYLYKSMEIIGGKGIGIQGLSSIKLHNILIPLPSLLEQQRIVDRLNDLEPLLTAYDILEKEDTSLDATLPDILNKSILQYAIQGKLVSQDPIDEPAAVLLDRIRDEKKRLIKEKKIKVDKNESIIYKGDDNSYYEVINKTTTCIDDQIPFEIPESWEWVRLGSIATLCGGFAFKSALLCEKGMRVIRISDFDESGFKSQKIVRHTYTESLSSYLLEKNNILMAMTGGTVGKSYLIKKLPEPMLINQRVAAIKATNFINPYYIDSVIKSPLTVGVINDAKNSTNDNISMNDIYNFLIPLPPKKEQDRIANMLLNLNSSLSNILLL